MSDSPDLDLRVPAVDNPDQITLPSSVEVRSGQASRSSLLRVPWSKIALFGVSLFLFILALTLMKEGACSLAPLVRNQLAVTNPANSLGFGWLFAYVIMSGSPVAAAALTFFEAGVIDQMGAFTMITGSRLGASFIVLLIGFIYVLRGQSGIRRRSYGSVAEKVQFGVACSTLVVREPVSLRKEELVYIKGV